jgi:hypothetical protein
MGSIPQARRGVVPSQGCGTELPSAHLVRHDGAEYQHQAAGEGTTFAISTAHRLWLSSRSSSSIFSHGHATKRLAYCRASKRDERCDTVELGQYLASPGKRTRTLLGSQIYVEVTPGQQEAAPVAESVTKHAPGRAVIADTECDSEAIRVAIRQRTRRSTVVSVRPRFHVPSCTIQSAQGC